MKPVILHGNSHDSEIVARVREFVPFDFLFIDGDHSYEGVKADYENYSPMVKPGGMVAFHDIEGAAPGRFWEELPGNKEEIRLSKGMGVGLLRLA